MRHGSSNGLLSFCCCDQAVVLFVPTQGRRRRVLVHGSILHSNCASGPYAASPLAPVLVGEAVCDSLSAHHSWEFLRLFSTRTSQSSRRNGSCRACFPRQGRQ